MKTVEKELKQLHVNWGQAADRTKWMTPVSALYAKGDEED